MSRLRLVSSAWRFLVVVMEAFASVFGTRFAILLAVVFAVVPGWAPAWADGDAATGPKVHFNETYIDETLSRGIDLRERNTVLAHVIGSMPPLITVYPSEGYYYFSFFSDGEVVGGNLRFDASSRDRGEVAFAYFTNHGLNGSPVYFSTLTASDGVELIRESSFHYRLSFGRHTRKVFIYDAARELANKPSVGALEEYVGPIFDESGVRFHLIFDHASKEFLYLHNTDLGASESFRALDNDAVLLVGNRTGYAYFHDKARSRRVLVGVRKASSAQNSYLDGPFDQLPDSFVDPLHLKALIEKTDPRAVGRIGPYGMFIKETGSRYAIVPYLEYREESELFIYLQCSGIETLARLNGCLANEAQP